MAVRLSCPTCQREISWSEQYPHRPFCSERCRLIDLGAWLSEQHAIADEEPELGGEMTPGDATKDS
ncbi:MAG TPA: DNA gyrase inhibitor YacG [Steroidobacteraceae bacterium]